MTEQFANGASTTINQIGGIASGDSTVTVTSAASFPSTGNFRILIDTEIILVTAVSTNTFTITRAQESTSAASHSNGAIVTQVLTKGALVQFRADNTGSGAAASRPSATGSGKIYGCEDSGVLYLDDPATSTWKGYNSAPLGTGAGAVGSYTVVGTMSAVQKGDALALKTAINSKAHQALLPIPGGVTAGGPWAITLIGHYYPGIGSTYPEFGISLSNGTTAGTSTGLFCGVYQFNGSIFSLGAWTETINTNSRPSTYFGDNSANAISKPHFLRLLCDGTNYFYQYSGMQGASWRTFLTNTKATVAITPTNFGVSLGGVNGSGFASALIENLSMVTVAQPAVSNVTLAGSLWTITTSTAHGMVTGDSVSVLGITYTGTASTPNGIYDSSVIVSSSTVFTIPGPGTGTFTYTSGGTITVTS